MCFPKFKVKIHVVVIGEPGKQGEKLEGLAAVKRRLQESYHLWYAQRTRFTRLGHKDAIAKGHDLVLFST